MMEVPRAGAGNENEMGGGMSTGREEVSGVQMYSGGFETSSFRIAKDSF